MHLRFVQFTVLLDLKKKKKVGKQKQEGNVAKVLPLKTLKE